MRCARLRKRASPLSFLLSLAFIILFAHPLSLSLSQVLLKQKDGEVIEKYSGSGSFGELALLYNVPRASTVRCAASGALWALDRRTFRHALMSHNKHEVDQTARFLKAVELLSPLTHIQHSKLATALEELTYEDGATLWDVGDKADWLA